MALAKVTITVEVSKGLCLSKRISMRMQKATYIVIFLSVWVQFDDTLLAPSRILQSARDDDEYLSVQREPGQKRESHSAKSVLDNLKSKTADLLSVSSEWDAPSGSKFAGPISPSPLYVFMSLQF
jgi:hypothetical protein